MYAFAHMLLVDEGVFIMSPHFLYAVMEAMLGRLIAPRYSGGDIDRLDSFARGETDVLRGSPYLLYMWLTERFSLISVQEQEFLIGPSRFFRRYDYVIFAGLSSIDWPERLVESFRLIRWSVPWWGLRIMVMSTGSENYIHL